MENGKKYRMKSWYWGNYCVQLENGKWLDNSGSRCVDGKYFSPSDLEPYIEEEHGWHHSEEFRLKHEDQEGNKIKEKTDVL